LTTTRTILISGAGIAGPTLAYWLMRYGFEPTIVERAPAPRRGGYIIDFWGVGHAVAERMNLLQNLRERSYDPQEMRFVNSGSRPVSGFSFNVLRKALGDCYFSILRGDLAECIYESIDGKIEVIYGDSTVSLEQGSDGVEVGFEHACPRRFDLVIGADGLHSLVRRLVFGPDPQFTVYLGYGVAAFSADSYLPRD